jgi:hypothetical protein
MDVAIGSSPCSNGNQGYEHQLAIQQMNMAKKESAVCWLRLEVQVLGQ